MVVQRQRVGLILGLMAWCMQLVVFVQPFLPGHSAPGFGICQIIIDALSPNQQALQASHHYSSQQHNQSQGQQRQPAQVSVSQHHQHLLHHHQADVQHPQTLTASSQFIHSVSTEPAAPAHMVDHHFSHLSCGFCTLYGHAIPPPGPQPLWSATALTLYVTLPRFSYSAVSVLTPHYIKPQSRAPPVHYIA
jgi:hypothetical protein